MALNLEKQLVFYGSYHRDPTNIAIHMVCVPIILATGLMLAENIPLPFTVPTTLSNPYFPLNVGTITSVVYAVLYLLLEPFAGAFLIPFVLGSAALGHYLIATYGAQANYVAGGVHVVSWLAQFVGHGKFEGRAPTLLDNLVQAIFLAPLFVWLELLFMFGYRPELKKRLDVGVEKELRRLNAEKKRTAVNGKVH